MRKYILLLLIFFSITDFSFGQFQNILISTMATPNEPSICINPKNTNEMVAGSNLNNIYKSSDGGFTWQRTAMASSFGVWGDPCIVADTSGKFYYFHLSNTGGANGWIDRMVCQRLDSINGIWSAGVGFGLNGNKDQDKEWVAVNHLNNELYATWTQFDSYNSSSANDSTIILFSKSSNNGNSWSTPMRISKYAGDCLDSDNTTEGAVPAVGPNGEIYVAWSNHQKIYFDKSNDGGNTWMQNDIEVATQPGGWDFQVSGITRTNGFPVTVCDHSGGVNNGTIYINWSDQRNGVLNTDVFIIKSTDGGATWSNPLKVNSDTTVSHQFFNWMSIDQTTGYIYVAFYDRSNYTANSDSTDVYLAFSKDGGNTFQNFKINSSSFVPNSNSFFGDYINISAHNGVVRPIWTRMDNGNTSIYTAIIDSVILGFKLNNEPIFVVEECAAVYYENMPFIAYKLRKNANVSIFIYNVLGELVGVVKNNEPTEYGKHLETIDKNKYKLNGGIYYCLIKTDDKIQIKKIIVE